MRRSYAKSLFEPKTFVWRQSCNLSGPGPQFSWTKWIAKRRQVAGEAGWEDPSFVWFSVIHRLESLGLGWRPELSVCRLKSLKTAQMCRIIMATSALPADDHTWKNTWNRTVQKFEAKNSTKPSYQLVQAICQNCSDRSIIAIMTQIPGSVLVLNLLHSVQSMFCTYRNKN